MFKGILINLANAILGLYNAKESEAIQKEEIYVHPVLMPLVGKTVVSYYSEKDAKVVERTTTGEYGFKENSKGQILIYYTDVNKNHELRCFKLKNLVETK